MESEHEQSGGVISLQERQEFEEFKRRKRVAEARAVISRLELSAEQVVTERASLRRALREAEKCGIGGVSVTPCMVRPCADFLGKSSSLKIVAALSPWGGTDTTDVKVRQIRRALRDGAAVAEISAPLPAVKEGNWAYVKRELKKLRRAAGKSLLRINIESPLLTPQELAKLCSVVCECGITCVRMAGPAFGCGADEEEVKAAHAALKSRAVIKADGAENPGRIATLLECGAELVGSASAVELARAILSVAEK